MRLSDLNYFLSDSIYSLCNSATWGDSATLYIVSATLYIVSATLYSLSDSATWWDSATPWLDAFVCACTWDYVVSYNPSDLMSLHGCNGGSSPSLSRHFLKSCSYGHGEGCFWRLTRNLAGHLPQMSPIIHASFAKMTYEIRMMRFLLHPVASSADTAHEIPFSNRTLHILHNRSFFLSNSMEARWPWLWWLRSGGNRSC